MFKKCMLSAISISICAGTAQAQGSPYCGADLVFDNTLDFFDVSAFINAYNQGDLIVDYDESGFLNFFDVSAFILMFNGDCPDLTDTDLDRIPDFAETHNGDNISALSTGSDPLNADTDGDGLRDGDEVLGTVDGLILPGASPVFKDIYVECDWFEGNFQGRNEDYRPTNAVNNRVVDAFRNATTPNPYDNGPGINIHLDFGQGNGHTGGNQLPGSPDVIQFDSEFNEFKAIHFDPRRKGYYHYAMFANRYNSSDNNSSGFAELNGDDFMVTMVDYNSTRNMANTIAHELGHNLGLHHGGFESRNWKPNYNSVMNYRFQFPGIDTTGNARGNGRLDYSVGAYNNIIEFAVLEANGVDGMTPIDWNQNGIIEEFSYPANINCRSQIQECGSFGSGCDDRECTVLQDHDDWNNIVWNRLELSSDRLQRSSAEFCDNWPGK